jgi:ParB-like chromosome segregation protein Spo0J
VKVSLLSPHPKNSQIYDEIVDETLQKSIQTNGLIEPLLITPSGRILSGHRRFAVITSLGWEEVEVRVVEPENEIITIIEANRYRSKSAAEILRESKFLENELRKQIGRGRNAAKNRSGRSLTMDLEISKTLGVGTTRLKQLKSIEKYDPHLLTLIEKKKISVSAAYKKVRGKFGKNQKKETSSSFDSELRKLLNRFSPSLDKLDGTISKIYPYSLDRTGISTFERDELKSHLEELASCSSDKLMMSQKLDEIEHSRFSKTQISKVRKMLPKPKEIKDFCENSYDQFEVIPATNGNDEFSITNWRILRERISALEYFSGPGRRMKFFVGFRTKKKFRLLGIVELSSDAQRLSVRDDLIGWDDTQRAKNRECVANVSTCVATQPFGSVHLGMKFLVATFPQLITHYEDKYDTKLVALLTTSIHGSKSVYKGIPFLRNIGKSSGKQLLKPLREDWTFWNSWLTDNFQEDMEILNSRSSPLQGRLKFLYSTLGLNPNELNHSHQRGVFLMSLYENWKEFLKNKISEKKLKPIESENWINWWRRKSKTRYEKLEEKGNLSDDLFFLDETDEERIKDFLYQ